MKCLACVAWLVFFRFVFVLIICFCFWNCPLDRDDALKFFFSNLTGILWNKWLTPTTTEQYFATLNWCLQIYHTHTLDIHHQWVFGIDIFPWKTLINFVEKWLNTSTKKTGKNWSLYFSCFISVSYCFVSLILYLFLFPFWVMIVRNKTKSGKNLFICPVQCVRCVIFLVCSKRILYVHNNNNNNNNKQ